jgi:hypothetical protein
MFETRAKSVSLSGHWCVPEEPRPDVYADSPGLSRTIPAPISSLGSSSGHLRDARRGRKSRSFEHSIPCPWFEKTVAWGAKAFIQKSLGPPWAEAFHLSTQVPILHRKPAGPHPHASGRIHAADPVRHIPSVTDKESRDDRRDVVPLPSTRQDRRMRGGCYVQVPGPAVAAASDLEGPAAWTHRK